MMKALDSGVTGLQSHQIAMDVESNNIANVNTIGFKYSRANFSDLLAQTSQIATAPQGSLGGKNSVQVGLGASVNSITKIMSQGSIQNTDKNTDVAIQGDGFFVVSGDGGNTYKYSRSGDFKFDAAGNFVDNNGFIVQGWTRDKTSGLVDSSAPISNIKISPGLTTPANPTSEVSMKANLSSGDTVTQYKPIYTLDTVQANKNGVDGLPSTSDDDRPENFNVLFDASGNSLNLQNGQGNWTSYTPSRFNTTIIAPSTLAAGTPPVPVPSTIAFTLNGVNMSVSFDGTESAAAATSAIAAKINANVATTGVSAAPDPSNPAILLLTNDNTRGTTASSKNINLVVVPNALGMSSGSDITAFQYTFADSSSVPVSETTPSITARTFTTTEDLRAQMQWDANLVGNARNSATFGSSVTQAATALLPQISTFDAGPDGKPIDVGMTYNATINGTTVSYTAVLNDTSADVATQLATLINAAGLGTAAATTNGQFTVTGAVNTPFTTSSSVTGNSVLDGKITVDTNAQGQFEIKNPGSSSTDEYDLRLSVTGLTSTGVVENTRFTQNFQTLSGTLTSGSTMTRTTQAFNAATHAASIDVFDSLGTKHTLQLNFRKSELSSTGGTVWTYEISVPAPGDIGGSINPNELINFDSGRISFTNTGALANATIPSITYTANNGSAPLQTVNLNFGTINGFDGITSFDNPSGTSGISQDGYPGGDLVGIRIDQSGTLIGSFTNGRSFGLAQISMAKFTNNEGLMNDGGNVFLQSANSGDPIIGTAATAGRGFMQSSALEGSNVDLSKSLTNLIVIQRGYQANAKTITTSDTLLETLLGIKR